MFSVNQFVAGQLRPWSAASRARSARDASLSQRERDAHIFFYRPANFVGRPQLLFLFYYWKNIKRGGIFWGLVYKGILRDYTWRIITASGLCKAPGPLFGLSP
uniref:Uncharacterized protein n=1 Tax=Morchella brunnea TaxID=1174671 RepID=A0A8K1MIK3_9PEZI|nr:hypothetical protein LK370_mgp108 [Morchella brunnea]UBU98552.1 hypothetical protein [Morchella brunnea]